MYVPMLQQLLTTDCSWERRWLSRPRTARVWRCRGCRRPRRAPAASSPSRRPGRAAPAGGRRGRAPGHQATDNHRELGGHLVYRGEDVHPLEPGPHHVVQPPGLAAPAEEAAVAPGRQLPLEHGEVAQRLRPQLGSVIRSVILPSPEPDSATSVMAVWECGGRTDTSTHLMCAMMTLLNTSTSIRSRALSAGFSECN